MKKPAERPVYWYARAKGIARMGTFPTQLEAWEAVMGTDGTPIEGAIVWCEAKDQTSNRYRGQNRK